GLGHAYLWTRIFEYLGIDFSGDSGRRISQNNIIDERTIHHMGRGIEEGEEQQEPPPPQEQAPQEQAPQAGPSEQPSMRDIMQVLQRIERKQARMDRRLHRIEQYMEIEEDEDEDQD
ncbi:hypothetical protein PIB30_110269, partial [Stylosanthes scabra]|nr:hypothetical protein [Stylosanthes scabra]